MDTDKFNAVLNQIGLEAKLIDEIKTIGRLRKVNTGQVVASAQDASKEIPLVLTGLLKVIRQDENGSEIFLYYLEGGETCAMSITCCIENKTASYKIIAEENSTLWMIL